MVLWPWDDFVRPIRSYFSRRRSRWRQPSDRNSCPSCKSAFDKSRKRRVVDSCGHYRCYACLCEQEICPLCPREKTKENLNAYYRQSRISTHSANDPTNYQNLNAYRDDQDFKRFSMVSRLSFDVSMEERALSAFETKITLKPLYFEVPQSDGDGSYLYRDWVFKEINKLLNSNIKGVVLVGDEGSGKTFLTLQLVDWSSFGRKRNLYGSLKRSSDTLEKLASQVVGYHFCQVDCIETCRIPDFIHSLAAQLCQAPQLSEYRNLLIQDESYQDLLSLDSCIENSDEAFIKGILEPLRTLEYPIFTGLLVIDSVHEAETHSNSIASFLAKHISQFPLWLKVVLSVRSDYVSITSSLNFHPINLKSSLRQVQEDLLHYIQCRIRRVPTIQSNISATGDEKQILRFAEHLITCGHSSFLYSKLILDLLQQNHLVVKSSSFNVIPVSLEEVFTLIFNLRFPSAATFSKVLGVLEICMAAQSPLTAVEIFYALESASVTPTYSWQSFTGCLRALSGILVQRNDASLVLFHPSIRTWLSGNKKFPCDARSGFTRLALLPSRLKQPLTPEKTLEFLYNLTRCGLFDKEERLKALWMHQVISMPSSILSNPRALFQPDTQVFHLLLESGADADLALDGPNKSPIIHLLSKLGCWEAVDALLRFKADPNKTDVLGSTALIEAAKEGHLKVVEVLLDAGVKIQHQTRVGQCALSIAAERGHLETVDYLLRRKVWTSNTIYSQAVQRALIAAAGGKNFQVCNNLLKLSACPEYVVQGFERACSVGHEAVCEFFLQDNASPSDYLFSAAACGHLNVLKILSSKGVNLDLKDMNGRSAISWACVYRQYEVIRFLLEAGVDTISRDSGSNHLLHLAAIYGNSKLVHMLKNYGVQCELKNNENMTPLECAIFARNISSTRSLLLGEADISSKAFECAKNNNKFLTLLLNKLLNDGIAFYKQSHLADARYRFELALNQAPKDGSFSELVSRLREGLAAVKRKSDGREKVEDSFM